MKALKIIGAVFCGLMFLTGVANIISPPQPDARIGNFIVTLIFLALTILLIRSIRKGDTTNKPMRTSQLKGKTVSPYLPEVPAETLRDMKKHYTTMQIQNDIRILRESLQLIEQTTDFDTFFMRLDLSQKKALTLLQAVQAGCKGIPDKQQMIKSCESVLSNTQAAKMVFLDNSYKKETTSAMQLKTKAGQHKRLCAYLERLQSYEEQFSDVQDTFNGFREQLQNLIAEVQPDSKSSTPHSRRGHETSPADEIMKCKQLLDAGAITQEEYDTKKKQLLNVSSV